MSAQTVAAFEDVRKEYPTGLIKRRSVHAVRGVSFTVAAGQIFGLLGPNRAGKTTLVKLLLSLCQPTSGRVLRLGEPVSVRSTLGHIGYMHENQAFPRYHSASSLLEYYGALTLLPADHVRQRTGELLKLVGLADRAHEAIWRFSKGMRQRLALAQALINDPELLVLDEPTEGLDLEGRQLLRDTARTIRDKGKTVLLVSHVLSEVEQLCDRVAVLVDGQLRHVGRLADLSRDGDSGSPRPLEQVLKELYEKGGA